MTDKVTPERVAAFAAAARVPIPQTSPPRITNAVASVILRMADENIQLPLEVEPASFVIVARQGAKR